MECKTRVSIKSCKLPQNCSFLLRFKKKRLININYFNQGATIQSKEDVRVAEDDKAYSIINLPGFEQNTTFAECL